MIGRGVQLISFTNVWKQLTKMITYSTFVTVLDYIYLYLKAVIMTLNFMITNGLNYNNF